MASVIINPSSELPPSLQTLQEATSVDANVLREAPPVPKSNTEIKPVAIESAQQWISEAINLVQNIPNSMRRRWLVCFPPLLILCIFLCAAASSLVVPTKDVVQCIRILYSQKNGQYACIDWHMQLQPMIGARRVTPSFEPMQAIIGSVDVYTDANQNYFAACWRKYVFFKISEKTHGLEAEIYDSYYVDKLMPMQLLDNILLNTVGINSTIIYDVEFESAIEDSWYRLIYYAMLDNASPQLAFTCERQIVKVGPFVISKSRSQILLGDKIYPASGGIISFAQNGASTNANKILTVGYNKVFLSLNLDSPNEFTLQLDLPPLSRCHGQIEPKYTLNTPQSLLVVP